MVMLKVCQNLWSNQAVADDIDERKSMYYTLGEISLNKVQLSSLEINLVGFYLQGFLYACYVSTYYWPREKKVTN